MFTLSVASLIIPSILVSLGVGLLFNELGFDPDWYSSAFGAQLTWTLPFGLLIMFAVFNRFNRAWEEAARDQGATPWQSFWHVVLPIIAPSVIGIALFGFTLSYDEFARTLLTAGSDNTLPLEIFGMTTSVTTPVLYALGTLTTVFSFAIILFTLVIVRVLAGETGAKLKGYKGGNAMPNVTVPDHPLLRHKLTLLRDRFTPTSMFRQVAREISLLMAYEVTRDLPLEPIDIETPLEPMRAEHLAGKKLCIVSILRAGNGILEGMLDLVPPPGSATLGCIAIRQRFRRWNIT